MSIQQEKSVQLMLQATFSTLLQTREGGAE